MPQRLGTAHPHLVPYQTFDASDGALLIAAGNDRLFARLCGALGVPEWITDRGFAAIAPASSNRAELIKLIGERSAQEPRQIGSPGSPRPACPARRQHHPEVLQDPQVAALEILQEVPGTGVTLTGLPISFDGKRPQIRALGPQLGQDNAQRLGAAPQSHPRVSA